MRKKLIIKGLLKPKDRNHRGISLLEDTSRPRTRIITETGRKKLPENTPLNVCLVQVQLSPRPPLLVGSVTLRKMNDETGFTRG